MKTSNQTLTIFAACAIFLLPTSVSASVRMTEVMYDAPGSDSRHEWIEIQNQSDAPVDASKLKLFESAVNHSVVVVRGASILPPGAVAVLVKDPATFAADWPAFSGSVFKSSFSLSNIGETLVLKSGTSTVAEDTATYSSSMGASGDGLSLHRVGSVFVSVVADPGVVLPEYRAVVKQTFSTPSEVIAKKNSTAHQSSQTSRATPLTKDITLASSSADNRVSLMPRQGHNNFPLWEALAGLGSLLVLGIAGAWYVYVPDASSSTQKSLSSEDETLPSANEFDIE